MTQPPSDTPDRRDWVGPVLQPGPIADAVIAAIREQNAGAEVVDRGSYLRVLCARRCRVTRAVVERHRGGAFRLPMDLEAVMSSFKGRLSMSEDEACWDA
ncbi:MAG TPA: MmoB/DmpM family protein [Polyangia bacterium]|nr:MmoB/DmpM family protein [Polyangia bacterium]